MKSFIFIAIAIAALLIIAITSKKKEAGKNNYKTRKLLSPAERSFYGVLKQAVNGEHEIFTKVRLADLLEPTTSKNRQASLNRIISKHIDFIICDMNTLEAKLAIELDDKSHERADRLQRDKFVKEICEEAGLKIINIKAKKGYNIGEIRTAIKTSLAAGQGLQSGLQPSP